MVWYFLNYINTFARKKMILIVPLRCFIPGSWKGVPVSSWEERVFLVLEWEGVARFIFFFIIWLFFFLIHSIVWVCHLTVKPSNIGFISESVWEIYFLFFTSLNDSNLHLALHSHTSFDGLGLISTARGHQKRWHCKFNGLAKFFYLNNFAWLFLVVFTRSSTKYFCDNRT